MVGPMRYKGRGVIYIAVVRRNKSQEGGMEMTNSCLTTHSTGDSTRSIMEEYWKSTWTINGTPLQLFTHLPNSNGISDDCHAESTLSVATNSSSLHNPASFVERN